MDSGGLGDLSAVIGALSKNPAMLSALGGIMESLNQKPPPEPKSPDIGALLGLLTGKSESEEKRPSSGGGGIFGSKEDVQNRIALLSAVKPFLSRERQEKLDLLVKFLKLSELGELTRLLGKTL